MHPIAMPLILVGYILTVVWVLWSTVIAFFGGKLPVFGWQLNGGILLGVFWVGCLWPIAFGLTYLVFKLLDRLLWWLDERLKILFRSSKKSADEKHNPSPTDVDELMQQSMPNVQNAAIDMMKITRDALAKGVSPETMVDILINKMGFPKEDAQAAINNLVKEIRRDTDIEKPANISKTKTGSHDTADPDVMLMQSGLTQAVVADIALGIDTDTTIATLIAVGMPETKAKAYVGVLLDSFMEMSNEEREETRRNIKRRMEIIDTALSNGVNEDSIVQSLIEAEDFTREQAEGIVNYCSSVYKIRKR